MLIRLVIWTLALVIVALLAGALATWHHKLRVEARFPVLGDHFEFAGLKLHYHAVRQAQPGAPTLIFLHGASTNLRDFDPLVAELDSTLGVVALDRPGSGYSSQSFTDWVDPAQLSDAVMALQQYLGLERSIWVGHSLAGSVVMAGLLRHQGSQGVSAGILLAGAAYGWEGGVDLIDHLPGWPLVGPVVTHSLITPLGLLAMNRGLRNAFAPEAVTPDYQRTGGIGLYLRPGQFTATARDIRLLNDFLTRQSGSYGRIQQPVLIIHGTEDDIVPAWNHADRLIKDLARPVYHPIAGGGHQPHHVHVEQAARWIEAFVREQL